MFDRFVSFTCVTDFCSKTSIYRYSEKICRQFIFLDRCNQINMRIDENINNQFHIVSIRKF